MYFNMNLLHLSEQCKPVGQHVLNVDNSNEDRKENQHIPTDLN